MRTLFINAEQALKEKLYYIPQKGTIHPKTLYIISLMDGVGIYHLYDKADFYKLLYRLAVIHHQHGLLASFFTDEVLFRFEADGVQHKITVEELQHHFGIQISEPINNIPDKKWNKEYAGIWNGSRGFTRLIGKIKGGDKCFSNSRLTQKISPKMKADARLLVSVVKKELDDSVFRKWKKEKSGFLTGLEKERMRRSMKFSFDEINGYIVDEYWDYLEQYNDFEWEEDKELFEEIVKLGWCYAYDLVYQSSDGCLQVYPEIPFNYDQFEEIDGHIGIPSLEAIHDEFDLGRLVDALKTYYISE